MRTVSLAMFYIILIVLWMWLGIRYGTPGPHCGSGPDWC